MRSAITISCVVLLTLVVGGCDSEDPARVESQVVTISMNVNGARTDTYDVWDMIIDNNADAQPDDGQTYLWCENSSQTLAPITLPWTFSVQIDRVPGGTTVTERISSDNAVDDTFNVGNYDTAVRLDTTNQRPPITEDGNTYRFFNPRKHPAVNEGVSFATFNPLAQSRGNLFGTSCGVSATTKTRCGLCAQVNNGLARIDGVDVGGTVVCSTSEPDQCSMPWTITIDRGDTIVFQSRIAEEAPIGIGLREVVNFNPTSMSAKLEVDGREVPLQGISNGAAISFSYTSR